MEVHYWQDANESGTKALNESVRTYNNKSWDGNKLKFQFFKLNVHKLASFTAEPTWNWLRMGYLPSATLQPPYTWILILRTHPGTQSRLSSPFLCPGYGAVTDVAKLS